LRSLVPIDAGVVGLPANGHDVDVAIAVQIGDRKILNVNAALIEQVTLPLRALIVERLENPHTAFLARLVAEVIADSDSQLVAATAIEIGTPAGMAPFQLVVENMALPKVGGVGRRSVHNDLVAVPRFNGCDE